MAQGDKGLLFFYDWEECFEALPDKDFKEMVLASLTGIEPICLGTINP